MVRLFTQGSVAQAVIVGSELMIPEKNQIPEKCSKKADFLMTITSGTDTAADGEVVTEK